MSNILVTGGTGFIGGHLIEELLAAGHQLSVLSLSGKFPNSSSFLGDKVTMIHGDFGDSSILDKAIAGKDWVLHVAWESVPGTSMNGLSSDLQGSVSGSVRLAQCCAEHGAKLIFVSSGGTVYGASKVLPVVEGEREEPISAYGVAKLMVEKYLRVVGRESGLEYVILRPANVYGPRQNLSRGQGVIGIWFNRILNGENLLIYGDGGVVRDYLYVKDMVRAARILVETECANGETFNIGSGVGVSLNEVIEIISRVVGKDLEVERLPARKCDVVSNVLDSSHAMTKLDWIPKHDLEEGLCHTWRWLNEQHGL